MTVYCYDEKNGEYIGYQDCQESPLEPGVFLFPSGKYTTIVPPECEGNEGLVFNGVNWSIVPDWRGKEVWEKSTATLMMITELGVAPNENQTEKSPIGFEFPVFDETTGCWKTDTTRQRESLVAQMRCLREPLIRAAQDRIDRYRNEQEDGDPTTDSAETIAEVRAYIKALRQITEQEGFPYAVNWPKSVS